MAKAGVVNKPYNAYLDVLKGFAIALVVLGHSVQSYTLNGNYDNNILFRIIYSYHMPLFMFLSGAAAAYSLRPMNREFIKRKFQQLVIPYFAWYILGYFLTSANTTMGLPEYIRRIIVFPDNGLWFLWVLFLNFCCLAFIKKIYGRMQLWSYLVVWLAILAIPVSKYGVGFVKWYLPFFVIGYLIFTHRDVLRKYSKFALYFCAIAFPLLIISWHRMYMPSLVTGLDGRLVAHGLAAFDIGDIVSFKVYPMITMAYSYLVPFTGIGFTYWFFKLRPSKHLYGLFGFLGIYTLDIYVSQMYFFKYAFGTSWVAIISGFFIALGLSLALGMFVLRRVHILSAIFLGGRAKVVIPKRFQK